MAVGVPWLPGISWCVLSGADVFRVSFSGICFFAHGLLQVLRGLALFSSSLVSPGVVSVVEWYLR